MEGKEKMISTDIICDVLGCPYRDETSGFCNKDVVEIDIDGHCGG